MRRVNPGQPFRPSFQTWNNFVEAHDRSTPSLGGGPHSRVVSHDVIWLRNDSGGDIAFGEALGIGDAVFYDGNDVLGYDVVCSGAAIGDSFRGKFAIAIEPIKSGGLGRAVASGCCMAYVNVGNPNHGFADVGSSNKLKSGFVGGAQIISKSADATGTGIRKVFIRFCTPPPFFPVKATLAEDLVSDDTNEQSVSPFGTVKIKCRLLGELEYLEAGTGCELVPSPDSDELIVVAVDDCKKSLDEEEEE